MNTNKQIEELNITVAKLKSDLDSLSQQFYKNNFTSHQDFNKSCNFTTKLKIPFFTSLPSSPEVGDICVYSHDYGSGLTNNLMIATSTSAWTIVGTQSTSP